MKKLFLARFRYRHCCSSVIVRPSGYFITPHLALEAIEFETPGVDHFNFFHMISQQSYENKTIQSRSFEAAERNEKWQTRHQGIGFKKIILSACTV